MCAGMQAVAGAFTLTGYYAILDVRAPSMGPHRDLAADQMQAEQERAEQLLAAGPCCLQLRSKHLGDGPLLRLARAIGPLCRRASVPFCVNDRPDLAHLADADLVHVGQDDLAIADVRLVQERIGRRLPVGVSTHSLAQATLAAAAGADYIGFGPVFATGSKERPDPVVGLEGLRAVCRAVTIPVVAIGGITRARIGGVVEAGAAAAAVIGDIDTSNDRTAAGRAIAAAFGRSQHD
jgi:thiamine-phosphate pyrophosphorylase